MQDQPAVAGTPVKFSPAQVFTWLMSQPFENESDFTPSSQRIPIVEDERPIFVDDTTDLAITRGQLRRDALKFAHGIKTLHHLDPDDLTTLAPTGTCSSGPQIAPVVLIQLPNCLAFAPVVLGTLASGLTASLVSPALTTKELGWVLQNARPRLIITSIACLPVVREALKAQRDDDEKSFFNGVPVYTVDLVNDRYPFLGGDDDGLDCRDWKQLLASTCTPEKSLPRVRSDAKTRCALILWSSGTSGQSKGVLLSHHALNYTVAAIWHDADFYQGQRQRWLAFVPFYHVYGLLNLFLLAIPTGSTVYMMQAFNPKGMLTAIANRKITYLHMAPPVAVILAKSPLVEPFRSCNNEGYSQFSSIVGAVTGGAPLGHDIVRQVYDRLGFRVRSGYGLTEACAVSLQNGLGGQEMEDHKNDTGPPHWGVQIKVIKHTEANQKPVLAAVGEPGEVLVRSDGLMSAYLPVGGLVPGANIDMTATTESITSDGWFRTGDVGTLTADGRLRLTDRIKELIKVRAFQVPPAELEAVLCSSDEVLDAGVVGVYDDARATEFPRAFVVAANPKTDLIALGQRLKKLVEGQTANYKWLRGGIVFVDQIPKSPSGKILRRVLRDGGVKGVEVSCYNEEFKVRANL